MIGEYSLTQSKFKVEIHQIVQLKKLIKLKYFVNLLPIYTQQRETN